MSEPPPLPPIPDEREIVERRKGFLRVVLFFCFVFGCVFAYQAWHAWELHQNTIGDGRNVESYGYNLTNLTVPADLIVSSRLPRDGRLTLVEPEFIAVDEVDALNEKYAKSGQWKRVVVSSDIVIGTVANGAARAYPLRYMLWHEIVNDTLGGEPIAVTYHPLCASAVVFDRRVGDETLRFGFSGLLYNSNLVMYDKRESREAESLWSQLGARPIAGPAADEGSTLKLLPVFVGRFDAWREAHPETTVFPGDDRLKGRYKENPYTKYYRDAEPMFPVHPLVPKDGKIEPFKVVRVSLAEPGTIEPIDLESPENRPHHEPGIYALYFAWHAIRASESPDP